MILEIEDTRGLLDGQARALMQRCADAAAAAEGILFSTNPAAVGTALALAQVGDPLLDLTDFLPLSVRLFQQRLHRLARGAFSLMGVVHHLSQLAQGVIEIAVLLKQLHIQLGHIRHLTGLAPCHPGGVCRAIGGQSGPLPNPFQQFPYHIIHADRSFQCLSFQFIFYNDSLWFAMDLQGRRGKRGNFFLNQDIPVPFPENLVKSSVFGIFLYVEMR